ncbi:MAG: hypothetical protein A2902_00620 [Elusimicrobia bacterium RIFCSPLOWO2_01_FULL_64_13]|nr:MAG: hypothetical protein A2902_00620 [Elusimicrobia bacterium RIFCSPLOWO2_01_FULL_64_13]
MEEVWSLPDRTEARGPAGLEIVSDVPQADVIQFPERDAEPAPGPVLEVVPSREESVSQSDLLDVMEKFSNEIAPPPPPPAPKQEPQIVPEYPFKEEAEKLARKQSVAEKVRKLSKPLAALCAVSLLLALGAAGYNSARFQIWLASLKAKGAQAEPSPTAQVEKLPDLEPVVQAKTVSVNRVPAPKKTVPPPEPVPEVKKTVDPLEYQDYLLPGVKSPNVKEAAIEESPAEPAVEEPAPEPEIKIEEKKSGGGDKDSRQVEWMNQSGWGD